MTRERSLTIARGLALGVVIATSIYLFFIPEEQISRLQGFGYTSIFLISILANATIFLPAPGLVLVFSMGARFHPLGVAMAAGSGAALGEMSGYLAGFSGQAIIEDTNAYKRMVKWMERNGNLTVLLLAFLPNPLFDLTGIAAGALKMPVRNFLLWCWIGKIFKMLVIAYAGAGLFSIPFLNEFVTP